MRLYLESPTKLRIEDADAKELSELRASLTYRDKKVQWELQKHRKTTWSNEEAYQARLEELKSKEKCCLLAEGGNQVSTLTGFKDYLETKYGLTSEVQFQYPEPKSLPWVSVPDKTPWPYQVTAKEALLKARHGRVEMGTGLGKSFIILHLVRELGLKTIVMAPSTNIAEQLYNEFVKHLGIKYVGAFFDGKKDSKKLIVVGNAQSLTRVQEGSPAWEQLSKAQVFVVDESHQCPAATLVNVCAGIAKTAPYRFFFSATQIRIDGLDLLLDGITGHTVFSMTVREGVDQGYLAKPVFRMIKSRSDSSFISDDANEMTRKHLYYNPLVLKQAAEVINLSVEKLGHQVLVLIDEVEQFTRLLPLLRHKAEFAHGDLQGPTYYPSGKIKDPGNKDKVPTAYHESDPGKLVKGFNNGEFPILIGTSCISTGTDIQAVKTMVYLKGGKSEIEVKQGIGRCTRLRKDLEKNACTVVDFDVENIDILSRHAMYRRQIYYDIYGPVEQVEW